MQNKISDYDKYVLVDRGGLRFKKRIPIHVRAGAIYNFMLNENFKYKNKYNLIKSGDKVKFYYVKTDNTSMNVFGFLQGSYPLELNPPEFDYNLMFRKNYLEPINDILKVLYEWELPHNLVAMKGLF